MVLSASVNAYINTALPVSSESLAREFNLSSATVRSIFAELEEEGYLTHPYTSAGRIPTDKGYRYYVDFLTAQLKPLEKEKKSIIKEIKNKIECLDDLLEKTSEVISTITRYTGIVSLLEWEDKFFYRGLSHILEQPEFQDSERIRLLIKMLEEKKKLIDIINRDFKEPTKIYIGAELGCPEIDICSLVVSRYRRGKKQDGRLAVLGPRRMNYNHIIPTLDFISQVLSETLGQL